LLFTKKKHWFQYEC